jgi:hypothetical protein
MYKARKTTIRRRRRTDWSQGVRPMPTEEEVAKTYYENLIKIKCADWVRHSGLVKNEAERHDEECWIFCMWQSLSEEQRNHKDTIEIVGAKWEKQYKEAEEERKKIAEEKKKEEAERWSRVNEKIANVDAAIQELTEEEDRQQEKFTLNDRFCEKTRDEMIENIRKCYETDPPVFLTLGNIWRELKRRRQVEIDRIVARSKAKKAAKSQT